MTTTTGQSLWQALFFIFAILIIGVAVPILLFFVLPVLILAGGWVLRQPNRTPVDIFAGRTAIALSAGIIALIVFTGISSWSFAQRFSANRTSMFYNGTILTDNFNQPLLGREIIPEQTETPLG
jgi:hypothetical protein